MKKNYQKTAAPAAMPDLAMPDSVAISMSQIAGQVHEGLLALAVGAGLQVMDAVLEAGATELAGPKGKHNPGRVAVRHGSEDGSVILGGRRVGVRRPRVRATDGSGELTLGAYELFNSTDMLDEMTLGRMLAKVSTRRYGAALEPVGEKVEADARSTSKSSVSRRFVRLTETALDEMLHADLSKLDIVAMVIDGANFGDHLLVIALGIDIEGHKHPLGVKEGSTENTRVVTDLLTELRSRGLDTQAPMFFALDGAKALHAAVKSVFDHPVIQRCQEHKIRNVMGYLPQSKRSTVTAKMRAAYHSADATTAEALLDTLASDLEKAHPGAASSLREGLEETLTVLRLGVHDSLKRSLRSTNLIESTIEICRDHSANVKRWRDGNMAMRWCAAGMHEARKQYRRVNGHAHLRELRAAMERLTGYVPPEKPEHVTPKDYDASAA